MGLVSAGLIAALGGASAGALSWPMKSIIRFFMGGLFVAMTAFAQSEKPNIVVFLVDDMGLMDTSVPMLADENGNPQCHSLNEWYRTPGMERLAKQGVRFSNFYSHNVCSPTRVSIMTGQNSARHRTTDWINPYKKNGSGKTSHVPPQWNWEGLGKKDVTLPAILQHWRFHSRSGAGRGTEQTRCLADESDLAYSRASKMKILSVLNKS